MITQKVAVKWYPKRLRTKTQPLYLRILTLLIIVYSTTTFQSFTRALYLFGRLFFSKFGNDASTSLLINGAATTSKIPQRTCCPVTAKRRKTTSNIVPAKWPMKFMFQRKNDESDALSVRGSNQKTISLFIFYSIQKF